MRIAVIEIGSRAVRLLVADADTSGRIRVVKTGVEQISLGGALKQGPDSIARSILELKRGLERLAQTARNSGAEKLALFGTEALRRINEVAPDAIGALGFNVDILSKDQESISAFCAALTDEAVQAVMGRPYVVIDIGNGSIEIVAGWLKQGRPHVIEKLSLPLGIQELVPKFVELGCQLVPFNAWLSEKLGGVQIPQPNFAAKSILLGSAPTKAAWIQKRGPRLDAVYNPRVVSGATLSRKEIQSLIANVSESWAKSREAARNYVDFRIKDDSEVFMLICGMALVDTILQKQGRANCVVSAQGVRFGYLYQMLSG